MTTLVACACGGWELLLLPALLTWAWKKRKLLGFFLILVLLFGGTTHDRHEVSRPCGAHCAH